jgi:hypothetical protein
MVAGGKGVVDGMGVGAPAVRVSTEETPEATLVARLSTGGGVAVWGTQAALTRIVASPMSIRRKNRKFISYRIDDKYNAFRLFRSKRGFIHRFRRLYR